MKTSSIVASVLFGSMAAAAPMLNKRAYVTHTSTLIQTEVTYTTVYADEAKPSASGAAFFEKPSSNVATSVAAVSTKPATSVAAPAKPTTTAAPVKPSTTAVPVKPSTTVTPSAAVPTVQVPAPKPTTTQAPPPAAPTTSQAPPPKPASSTVAAAPASVASTPAAPATGGGATHSGGSMTIHPFGGALGSCGKPIADTDAMVALAVDTYGASTYDVATGNPTNKYCGMKINISYKGKTVPATIMDRCSGCTNGGLDVSPSLWKSLTGTDIGDRVYGMTWTEA